MTSGTITFFSFFAAEAFGASFLAVTFLAGAFLGATFFAVAFFAGAFLGATFLAVAFFAGAFFVTFLEKQKSKRQKIKNPF
jgi:membrane protein implicated in regulation of membrane protease activity